MRIGEIKRVGVREIPMPARTPPMPPEPADPSPEPPAPSHERVPEKPAAGAGGGFDDSQRCRGPECP
jgi:hypothetical protein